MHRLDRAARFQLLQARQRLTRLPVARAESRMAALLHRHAQQLDDLSLRMEAALSGELRKNQAWVAELAATVLRHDPRRQLGRTRERLAGCRARLDRGLERLLQAYAARLSALDARLHSLSPLAVLDRGYALVLNADGAFIRSAVQVALGDLVTTRLADGAFTSRVETASKQVGS